MDAYIKTLIALNLLILTVSGIIGDYTIFELMIVVQVGILAVVVCVKIFLRKFGSDDILTIEPIPDNRIQVGPQQDAGGLEFETILPNLETAIVFDSSGMKIIDPREVIPDVVCCSICSGNISKTRFEFGGILVCPHCGQWYHRTHLYDTANGKCTSVSCSNRR